VVRRDLLRARPAGGGAARARHPHRRDRRRPRGAAAVLIDISDFGDDRIADYRALTDVELRKRLEPEHGIFIAEGELVISRALAAGYAIVSALVSPKWLSTVEGVDAPVYVGSPELLRAVTGFHVHRGALAVFARRPLPAPLDVVAGARRVAVLEDVNTHTNVGAIFRAAAALGVAAVLLSPSCADPLYRRSVRVSMGGVFAVPYARADPWVATLDALRDKGFRLLALSPAGSADIGTVERDGPLALLLGAEGPGLSETALRLAEPVRIPMAAGVDSLNVAAAAAVAFYALA
jgi:tRNA G18 (ribose-2'-O)-methylase SpoU